MAEPMSLLGRWIVVWQRELLNRKRVEVAVPATHGGGSKKGSAALSVA
jgi:hypothetical protein